MQLFVYNYTLTIIISMGIANFTKWIKLTYPNAISPLYKQTFDNVYIDINYLLHCVITKSTSEGEILYNLCSYIESLLKYNVPTHLLVLGADGIAPLAKILLQKKRRLEYLRSQNGIIPEINPLLFSPGTHFMTMLDINLKSFIAKISAKYNVTVLTLFDGMGEAEMKLVGQIIKFPTKSHCIISTDADVIVICMSIRINNVFISNSTCRISIDNLIEQHSNIIYNKYPNIKSTMNLDFCFVSLLLGNDYLQKLGFISSPSVLWSAYRHSFDSCNINSCDNFLVKKSFNDTFYISESFMKVFMRNIVSRVKKQFRNKFSFADYDVNVYKNYVFGLLWCLNMYSFGFCDKFNYMSLGSSIHPIGLMYYFDSLAYETSVKNMLCDLNTDNNYGINNDIYATIIMPKACSSMIRYSYAFVPFPELSKLYESELCNDCAVNHSHYHEHDNVTMHDVIDIIKKFKQNQGILLKYKTPPIIIERKPVYLF